MSFKAFIQSMASVFAGFTRGIDRSVDCLRPMPREF